MKRILIEVAYDGTNYCGWQIQPNGMTVEEKLNTVLSSFLQEEIRVIGASRTDAGVHALGNAAVFDTMTTIPPDRICFALNTKLPEDIRIRSSKEVEASFHPRYQKSLKTYEYHIQNVSQPIPTERLYTHLVMTPLDVPAMREGASWLVGTHDFKSFCAAGSSAKTTVRTIESIEIMEYACRETSIVNSGLLISDRPTQEMDSQPGRPVQEMGSQPGRPGRPEGDRKIIIRVAGAGFLYNMVRIIAGTLIRTGLHVYPPEYVKEILEAKDRTLAAATAPAKGLFLKRIEYVQQESSGRSLRTH